MKGSTAAASGSIWLIDAAYIFQGHSGNIDYLVIRDQLQKWLGVVSFDQIIFYDSHVEDGGKSNGFHAFLKRNGFQVKLFPLKRSGYVCECCKHHGDRHVQRGVDVAICTDLLTLAFEGKFSKVILTCGDGDIIAAVQTVQRRFQQVYVSGYRNSMSNDLLKEVTGVYWF